MPLDPSALSIAEIREHLLGHSGSPSTRLLGKLQRDPRKGVQRIYRRLKKRQKEEGLERRRGAVMLRLERNLWNSGIRHIAGVDEVGVGPLAGPVVAASVMFPPQAMVPGVDDSKRVSPETRERLALKIRGQALGVGIGVAEVEEIERLNVYHASLLAMRRAVARLPITPEHLLVDARKIPEVSIPQSSFKKGDRLSFSIAAASIIAKTYRDQLMVEMDKSYPRYGFAQHKGYCTPAHMEAIRRFGPSDVHRKSFAFIQELCGRHSSLFYQLKKELLAAVTAAELRAFEEEFGARRAELGPDERRKIALLLTRRSVRFAPTLK